MALVDIGGETVDVIVCEGFHPLLDKCRIDTRATIALLKDVDSELQSELGETIPEQDKRKTGILREDEEKRIGITANDTELAEYYQQVQDALAGAVTGDSAEGSKDIPDGKAAKGERRSIREALAEKGRTKGTTGVEDRKREEQAIGI